MRCLDCLLLLALLAGLSAAKGQELPPIVAHRPPPAVLTGSDTADVPTDNCFNSYPDFRCEDWGCCHQWWCTSWYVRAELLTLFRNHDPRNRDLIQTSGGSTVLSADDFGFELAPGISTMLGRRIDGLTAFELSYFGANQWNDARAYADAANLRLPGSAGIALDDFNNASVMEVELRSQLHNAEINVLRDGDGISYLAGFRYLGWHEQISINALDSDLDESAYQVDVSNNLFGGQIGARWAQCHEFYDCEITAKAGLFGNEATQSQLLTNLDGTAVVRDLSSTDGSLSFVGDLNLSVSYLVHRHWRIRGGYNLMVITGIALAANQLDFSNNPLSGRRLRPDSEVFLHGFNVGLEAIW